jgi:hypothetical protein
MLAAIAVLALSASGVPISTSAAAPPAGPTALAATGATVSALPVTTIDGTFLVTVALATRLSALNPDVAKGVWVCSARVMTKRLIDAEIAKINGLSAQAAHDEFHSGLEYRAQYLGQQATSEFPITGGGYAGTLSLAIKVASVDLVDAATHRLIEDPGVMVGCWLRLLTSTGQGDFAYQAPPAAASAGSVVAMRRVRAPPYFLQSASVHGE